MIPSLLPSQQNLAPILKNKIVQVYNKCCCPILIFFNENWFQNNSMYTFLIKKTHFENWIWKSQEIHKIAKSLKSPILFQKRGQSRTLLKFGPLKQIDLYFHFFSVRICVPRKWIKWRHNPNSSRSSSFEPN